jgi:hypothetical protein
MTTLASATLELARKITDVVTSTATEGSATTLLDTARTEVDDYFTGGTIWFLSGNNAGKSAKISDWDLATKTFTFVTPGAACAAADRYAVIPVDYPRHILIDAINTALAEIGPLHTRNTALVTVKDQYEYTLPAGVYNILRVEIQYTTDTDSDFVPNYNWEEMHSEGKLKFDTGYAPDVDDLVIRLTYQLTQHTELTSDTGAIANQLPLERIVWPAAVHALRWRAGVTHDDEGWITRRLNEALAQAERVRSIPIPRMHKDTHMSRW